MSDEWTEPGIYRGKESNLIDPEEVQRYLKGSLKDHLVIQPDNTKRNNEKERKLY